MFCLFQEVCEKGGGKKRRMLARDWHGATSVGEGQYGGQHPLLSSSCKLFVCHFIPPKILMNIWKHGCQEKILNIGASSKIYEYQGFHAFLHHFWSVCNHFWHNPYLFHFWLWHFALNMWIFVVYSGSLTSCTFNPTRYWRTSLHFPQNRFWKLAHLGNPVT